MKTGECSTIVCDEIGAAWDRLSCLHGGLWERRSVLVGTDGSESEILFWENTKSAVRIRTRKDSCGLFRELEGYLYLLCHRGSTAALQWRLEATASEI